MSLVREGSRATGVWHNTAGDVSSREFLGQILEHHDRTPAVQQGEAVVPDISVSVEEHTGMVKFTSCNVTWSQNQYASGIAPVMRLGVAEVVNKQASNATEVARRWKESKAARKTSVPVSFNGIPFARNGNPNTVGGLDADEHVMDALLCQHAWRQQKEAEEEQKREETRACKAARHEEKV